MDLLIDTIVLFLLGLLGWGLFKLIKFPVPALLGTIFLVGGLRAANIEVPLPPEFIYPLVQLMFGLHIGGGLTKEATKKFKEMLIPILIVITWALTNLFLLGGILEKITFLDLKTAILSSSIGGLPEMTVLAMATDANVSIIVIAQSFRMIGTLIILPLIIQFIAAKEGKKENIKENNRKENSKKSIPCIKLLFFEKIKNLYANIIKNARKVMSPAKYFFPFFHRGTIRTWKLGFLTLAIAFVGGSIFYKIGVPAGIMVGATFFIAAASILGMEIKTPPQGFIGVVQIGLGLEVSKNISMDTFEILTSGKLLLTLLLLTLIIGISSFIIASIVHKITKWDFVTCLMACAPAGFAVMVALAIDYGKNSIQVTLLHMFRVLSIKICVPILFMLLF